MRYYCYKKNFKEFKLSNLKRYVKIVLFYIFIQQVLVNFEIVAVSWRTFK